jgi:hypothetical protein
LIGSAKATSRQTEIVAYQAPEGFSLASTASLPLCPSIKQASIDPFSLMLLEKQSIDESPPCCTVSIAALFMSLVSVVAAVASAVAAAAAAVPFWLHMTELVAAVAAAVAVAFALWWRMLRPPLLPWMQPPISVRVKMAIPIHFPLHFLQTCRRRLL